MIKGLAITPPVLGRISIGRVVEKHGKRLPEKDDQFTITTQVQNKDGWVLHPLDASLRKDAPNGKLRSIPVKMLFNDPDLNLRAEYTMFDRRNGRPLCVGNGETCRRVSRNGIESLPCPSPDACEVGRDGACKPYGRLNVRIGEEKDLGTFIFRTTGFNSIRTLTARLAYFKAISGNRLACMPLNLTLRGKSTTQSHRAPIYFVDLAVREGMSLDDAVIQAVETDQKRRESGLDQEALDQAARSGFANGLFEDSVEERADVLAEFYPEEDSGNSNGASINNNSQAPSGLKAKLGARAQQAATNTEGET
ncbi:MAG: hydrolase or metal-binding protein [Moraxellaceae bacterium]|nr:hydrolase or metal-binding protein [Moraxellaceae bacterium]